ncbi:MAG: hypothetical protein AABY43_01045 [Candidatus Omnitrophota bacterium]
MSRLLLFIFVVYFADIKINLLWAQGQEDKEEERQDEGTSKFLRDPFVYLIDESRLKPSAEEDSSLEKVLFPMVLRGVMVQEGKAVAVINEEVVTEGQTWHNFKVERIDKDGVTLTYQGRNLRLVMKESDAQAKSVPQDIKKMPSAGRK